MTEIINPEDGFTCKLNAMSVEVHILSDIHVGAKKFHKKLLLSAVERIKRKRNARVILNGDLFDNTIPGGPYSARDQYEQRMEQQVIQARDLLFPIRKKILFARSGNHDSRTQKRAEFNSMIIFCDMMGIPYYDGPGFTRINVTGKTMVLAGGHGKSGSQNGNLELERYRRIYDADVYYLGHNHQLFANPVPGLYLGSDGKEHLKEQWLIRAGSFLRYADYAREGAYQPQRCGWPTIHLGPEGITCTVRST